MAISISANSANFTITDPPSVSITSPNSGSFAYTSNIVVQFTKNNFTSNVNLYYTSSTTFSTSNVIATNFSGTQYTWDIPDSLSGTSKYIWVAKADETTVNDRTNAAISITSITINKPATDVSGFTESVTDAKTNYKTSFNVSDDSDFTESVNTEKRFWKVFEISDFTESVTDAKRDWKHIKAASDDSNFTESVNTEKRFWKVFEISDFTESITDDKRIWKHIKTVTDKTQFSGDTVTHEIVKWKQVISDITDFVETVSSFKTIGVPAANDNSAFLEDVNTAIHKRCKVRLFQDSPSESYSTRRKTGWIQSSKDLDKNTLIRRVNVKYHSADPITCSVYRDGDSSNPMYTQTLAAATNKQVTNKSLRIGRRAKLFMLELSTPASTNTNVRIEDIEVEVDG